MVKDVTKIGIIGAGNLGTQIALKLKKEQLEIRFIYSKTYENALILANSVQANPLLNLTEIPYCDLLFLTVPDQQIAVIAKELEPLKNQWSDTLVVHCSGASNIELLSSFHQFGVFYPLQTFTKNKTPDWKEIPIFIEGCNNMVSNRLLKIAKKFSENIQILSSEERAKIHCGAVLVSNFFHALAHAALEISQQSDFQKTYYPLVNEAIQKLLYHKPEDCLTGPAKRNDVLTLKKHLDLIKNPQIHEVYKLLSIYIQKNMLI
jgi:predicted short-subunit dehydrogenase-like oxidoreductase (DUF2520 family)